MGTILGPKYIPYNYMEPLGKPYIILIRSLNPGADTFGGVLL